MKNFKNSRKAVILIAMLLLVGMIATGCGKLDPISVTEDVPEGTLDTLTGEYYEELPVRPVMVSTDNVGEAIPQYGISLADIVYEVPVEGSQSRLEAIYYSKLPEVAGPTRSVRPYIVDLAREYDAILTHDGWSPQARKYLSEGKVADIPAQKYSCFHRISEKPAPHNEQADMDKVMKIAEEQGYLDEEVQIPQFSFFTEGELAVATGTEDEYTAKYEEKAKSLLEKPNQEYTIPSLEGITVDLGNECKTIEVGYANCKSKYTWDAEKGLYTRDVNGSKYKDLNNDKQIKMANVIVYKVSSKSFDHKGRLEIDMTKGGDAWVFTLGHVKKCKWSKEDLDSPTKFLDEEGNEIKLTPGKTWINIIDQASSFDFDEVKAPEKDETED